MFANVGCASDLRTHQKHTNKKVLGGTIKFSEKKKYKPCTLQYVFRIRLRSDRNLMNEFKKIFLFSSKLLPYYKLNTQKLILISHGLMHDIFAQLLFHSSQLMLASWNLSSYLVRFESVKNEPHTRTNATVRAGPSHCAWTRNHRDATSWSHFRCPACHSMCRRATWTCAMLSSEYEGLRRTTSLNWKLHIKVKE